MKASRITRILVGLSIALCCAVPTGAQQAISKAALIQQSPFIFRGTVVRMGASNLSLLPAAPDLAIVHVNEILKSPAALGAFSGHDITVQLPSGRQFQQGRQSVFYATGWLYGESLAVKASAAGFDYADSASLKDEVLRADQMSAEAKLMARVQSAALVISGRVLDVRPVAVKDAKVSEHSPDYWSAEVEIGNVVKGPGEKGQHVAVVFAKSTDEMWLKAPKLARGDVGVFLLHVNDNRDLGIGGYTVLDPLDVEPLERLTLVQQFVGKGR